MRISAAQRIQNENRLRAAMDRLLRGEIQPGGNCDVKTLARAAGVDRAALYGDRPYTHLRIEFEQRLRQAQRDGHTPDPKAAQIERLRADIDKLKTLLAQANTTIDQLTDFRTQALARLAHTKRSCASAAPPHRRPTWPTCPPRDRTMSSAHADGGRFAEVFGR